VILKGFIVEDYANYRKPSMFLAFPYCNFKCDAESGQPVCQNSHLANAPYIAISDAQMMLYYLNNKITCAAVCGGLEPFDCWEDLKGFIKSFRLSTRDDIVIYTGYNEDELQEEIQWLKQYRNIIIKFGRFIPGRERKYDEVLGVELASDNQYAVKIS